MNSDTIRKTWRISISLALAGFKVKNERSYLGVLWYLLDPIVLFITLLFIRGVFSNTDFELYPLYLLTGLITFNFFRKATSDSSNALLSNNSYLTSVNFPKFSLVLAGIFNTLIAHLFELVLLIVAMVYFNIPIWHILLYIPFLIIYFVFVTGIAQVLSISSVYINDLKNVWSIFTRLLWFATPIFYIAAQTNFLSVYNPLAYFIQSARSILIEGDLFTKDFGVTFLLAVVSITIGTLIFRWKSPVITEAL